jgi:hypothetical protein
VLPTILHSLFLHSLLTSEILVRVLRHHMYVLPLYDFETTFDWIARHITSDTSQRIKPLGDGFGLGVAVSLDHLPKGSTSIYPVLRAHVPPDFRDILPGCVSHSGRCWVLRHCPSYRDLSGKHWESSPQSDCSPATL